MAESETPKAVPVPALVPDKTLEGSASTAALVGDKYLLRCSFCDKSQADVRKLIAGPNVYICDQCVDLCEEVISEQDDVRNPDGTPMSFIDRVTTDLKKAILEQAGLAGVNDLTMRFVRYDDGKGDVKVEGIIMNRKDMSTALMFDRKHPKFKGYWILVNCGSLFKDSFYRNSVRDVAYDIARLAKELKYAP